MTYKRLIPVFVLAMLVVLGLPARAFAATTTVKLQVSWDEATCTERVNGDSGITRYAIAEGDTVVMTLENISTVPLNILYSIPNSTSTTKTVVANGNDVQTLANFTTTFQISPEPSSTFCGVSDKAYVLLYADPPPYTSAAALPPNVGVRQTSSNSNNPIAQSKGVEATKPADEASLADSPAPASQIYGDPQVTEIHGHDVKTIFGTGSNSWQLLVPPLLLLLTMGIVCLLRWRAQAAVREYNKPKKRAKKRK